jgi:hypothetical protein
MEAELRAITGTPEDIICSRKRGRSSQTARKMRGEVMDVILSLKKLQQ